MKSTISVTAETIKVGTKITQVGSDLLAEILGITERGIRKRANAEGWSFIEETLRGGRQKLFPIKTLPIDIRKKVMIALGELPAEFADLVPIEFDRTKIATCAKEFDRASSWQKELAKDRLAIIQALDTFRRQYTGRRSLAVQSFVDAYLGRYVEGLDPAICSRIPVVKRSRLYDWESRYKQQGIAGLISQHGSGHKGACGFPMEQQDFVLGTLAQNPNLKPHKIQRSLLARFGEAAMSRRQVGDFLKRRMAADPVVFAYLKDPDAAKGKYQLALGSASEKAERFLHYIEVDSTPADVMCADGKRYTIVGGIDIFSRKAKFVVTKTSNSWAIAGLIRQISTDWGLPETIVRDNGQDYASNMVNDGLMALGVKVQAVPPFTPEGKPHVERVFRTLSHDLLETLPGYIGHNVAERKAIENRKSFAERLGKAGKKIAPKGRNDKLVGRNDEGAIRNGLRLAIADTCHQEERQAPTQERIGLTPEALQAAINKWTEDVYHQRTHSGIKMSPNAKASTGKQTNRRIDDPRILDRLLAESGLRTIGKKGLRYDSGLFWNDALIDYMGRKVLCRLDIWDASKVFCFDPDTSGFICEALDQALEGITLADKISAKKRANKRRNEGVKAIQKLGEAAGDPFADEIERSRQERALVRNLPVGGIVEDNPFIAGARESIQAEDEAKLRETEQEPDWVPYEIERHKQIYEESSWRMDSSEPKKIIPLQSRNEEQVERLYFRTPRSKFEHYLGANRVGVETDEETLMWLRKYVDDWFYYADMFAHQWEEVDQKWLGMVAPDHFPQYVKKQHNEEETT